MTKGTRILLRRTRRLAAALALAATLSLIGGIGAGGAGLLPCAHHGHGSHSGDFVHGAEHSDLSGHPEGPDQDEKRCDCVGSCTLLAGPVSPLLGATIGQYPDIRTADEIVPIARPRALRQGWLYPLPNAPPSA
jgi:hypothetical protein